MINLLPRETIFFDLIEGLAEHKGRLFFGLRAPVRDGQATLLEVGTTELFSGKATLTHHRLALGRGRGVRDLTTLSGDTGFLVLVGPSGGPDSANATAPNVADGAENRRARKSHVPIAANGNGSSIHKLKPTTSLPSKRIASTGSRNIWCIASATAD
jgi:hypothetical protein